MVNDSSLPLVVFTPVLEHKQVPVGLDEFTITSGLVLLDLQAALRVFGIRCSIN